jgi:enediyne polyketide synthase
LDFIADQNLDSLRFIILGGEAVDRNDIRRYLARYEHQEIVNEYGPTETTVASIFHVVGRESLNPTGTSRDHEPLNLHIPIGKPVFNTRIYILDSYLNVVVLAPRDYKFAAEIEESLKDATAGGYCVCLPPNPDEHHIGFLLDAAKTILTAEEPTQALFVQHGGGAASFARTLHLEGHDLAVRVVDLPYDPSAFEHLAAECSRATNYTEAYYDREGMRRVPRLVLINPDETPASEDALSSDDVLLVTGGGKGIAAEAAAEIARETGIHLVLVGRSDPQKDEELAANLERFKANGIDFQYFSADVTDRDAISKVINRAQETAGPITAFLHGAGTNVPKLIRALDEGSFRRTVATKVGGARNVLKALDQKKLRLFVTFGSIIARSGMKGEADYALANEWLTRLTEEIQAENPHCRCVAVEWSVWSGVGMGERLGRIDSLIRQGVTPISSDEGIAILKRLISRRQPSVATVVTGRFGHPPALQLRKTELPLYRFLEQPQLHYPEIELVVDCRLSAATDPYLADHVFRGQRLLPGVMGLEAASQVSMALAESSSPPVFEDVRFLRPITVPEDTTRTIRLLAVQKSPGLIEVALRSDETAFATDHFRATCNFDVMEPLPDQRKAMIDDGASPVPLDPEADLYGSLLFHSGRFRRLTAYRRLSATDCLAEIRPVAPAAWFGDFLPPNLTLGDPAIRDATIHAIQACVPNASLLPIGARRLVSGRADLGSVLFVHAVERSRTDDVFTYDVEVTDGDGLVLEHWEGLQLQIVAGTEHRGDWVEPLLGPYLERRTRELFHCDDLSVVIDCDGRLEPSQRSDAALQRALGSSAIIRHRPDGKPEVGSGWKVSASDAGEITLAVAARVPVGCDIEEVKSRSEKVWRDLLQPQNFELARVIAGEAGEDVAVSATRIWSAMESLKKAGKGGTHSLTLHSNGSDGWVELTSGHTIVATYATGVRTSSQNMIFAVVVANHE